MSETHDSFFSAVDDGDISISGIEPDMGLFPAASERAFRFLSSHSIEQAIAATGSSKPTDVDPIQIVTLGAGFPWVAAMQANEQLRRCDSTAKSIKSRVHDIANRKTNFDDFGLMHGDGLKISRGLFRGEVPDYARTAVTNLLFNPPNSVLTETKERKRHKALVDYLEVYLHGAKEVYRRKNEPEPEIYRGNGGWETIYSQPTTPLRRELAQILGSDELATVGITLLARFIAQEIPPKLRPFVLSVLDTKPREELIAQAEVIYDAHPAVRDTIMYRQAYDLLDSYYQQSRDCDLTQLEDDSASVVIVSHWPLRHRQTGEADDAAWSELLIGLEHKLQTHGIAIFFPWDLPQPSNPEHLDITLGGIQAMMTRDFPFELSIVTEPTETIFAAIGDIGLEPAALAPQLRHGGRIGRLTVRKRLTLDKILK